MKGSYHRDVRADFRLLQFLSLVNITFCVAYEKRGILSYKANVRIT